VPKDRHDEVCALAKLIAEETLVVNPQDSLDVSGDVVEMIHSQLPIGPVVSEAQFNKIQGLIQSGIDEGATLIAGGLGRAEGFERGYFVRPTIFGNVKNSMTIAREEIFGPVVSIIEYDTVEEAIRIANDSPYGLSGYVSAETVEKAAEVAAQMQTGAIHLNGSGPDFMAPFGGVKKSGNGREWGEFGFEEYLENRTLIA
jgi:aldehyde dehydrogenase (NAD+)